MKNLLPAAGIMLMVMACDQSSRSVSLLSNKNLPSFLFEVDPGKDTVIHTPQGASISIKAGSLASGRSPVQLELKEAYHIRDIVAGGLITVSNGQPLSSGGMLYLAPAGKEPVKILKPITVTIPTPFIDRTMILYKGETRNGELVNWVKETSSGQDSIPVRPSPNTIQQLAYGKKIFTENCSTCHSLHKDISGPGLLAITDKMKVIDPNYPALLYGWVRNNQAILASGDPYFNNHFEKWNRTPMNVFPHLSDRDLDALFGYIDHEKVNARAAIPVYSAKSYDSCLRYFKEKQALLAKRARFRDTSQDVKNRMNNIKNGINPEAAVEPLGNRDNIDVNSYQFSITSFGWQNVDVLIDSWEASGKPRLNVTIPQAENHPVDIYLIVPSIRIFLPGARWKGRGNSYYFLDPAQNLSIPSGHRAVIIAMTDIDGQLWFGIKQIALTGYHYEMLPLEPRTPEEINETLKLIGTGDLTIRARKAANAAEAKAQQLMERSLDSSLKKCNCDIYF